MKFTTVFDVANQTLPWSIFAPGIMLTCVGALLVFAPDLMQRVLPRGAQGTARTILSWVILVGSLSFSIATVSSTYSGLKSAQAMERDGHYRVVEGPVTDFDPMPAEGHKLESFKVNGQKFSYSDYVLTPGFRNTTSHGGPIHPGLVVRISYVGNMILKLEVADEQHSS